MVPAITTPFKADMPPRGFGEVAHHLRGNGIFAGVFKHGLGALGIGLRLIAEITVTLLEIANPDRLPRWVTWCDNPGTTRRARRAMSTGVSVVDRGFR